MEYGSKEKKLRRKKILVAGDAMLDRYRFGKIERISPEAPVPVFLETGNERKSPGGAANVAVNIAAAGVETEFCTIIGADENGGRLNDCLTLSGVGTKYVVMSPERDTCVKLRYIGPGNQQILRVDDEDTSDVPYRLMEKTFQEIEKDIHEYSVFVISDYCKGFLTEDITQRLICLANDHDVPVLVDVKDRNISKYRNAMLLKPNRKELGMLTGSQTGTREDVICAAMCLCRDTSCKYVLATLGSEGMVLADSSGLIQEVKSTASEVYDVTGAGDTSIAYLAVELAKGKDIVDAMTVANYAAGVQVSKVGTSIVYPDEVITAMREDGNPEIGKVLNPYEKEGLSPLKRKKAAGKKVVFTNGCFDILHAGHVSYLRSAKKMGDILVVGVNSDESIKRLKGQDRPLNSLTDRMLVLSSLGVVDYIIPFEEDTPLELIKDILPDILVKGGDYQVENIVGADVVLQNGGEVSVLPFMEGRSTTALIHKIQKG